MDAVEKAIRNAFSKGNAEDRAFREKVYRSAFAALERALKDSPDLPEDLAERRRSALKAKIAEIETEFIPAVPPVGPPASASAGVHEVGGPVPRVEIAPARQEPLPAFQPDRHPPSAATVEPPDQIFGTEPRSRQVADRHAIPEPFFSGEGDFGPENALPDRSGPESIEVSAASGPVVAAERRRPLTAVFLAVTLLALAAIGVWWLVSTGLVKIPAAQDDAAFGQLPPEEEEFSPGEEAAPLRPGEIDAGRDWIMIFSPSDATTINAPVDATAQVMTDDSGGFVRIRSSASGSGISFGIAQGILEQIAGKHAVFNIVARAEEGNGTQFSVDCNFGEMGDCGRKRYQAGYEKGDFLFEIDLPAQAPGAEGAMAINTDVESSGRALDVYEIKVSVSKESP